MDLGLTYEIQSEPEKAAEVYAEDPESRPDNKRARDRLGRIFLKKKKFDEALDQFRQMQKGDSDDLDIRTKMGLIYLEQRQARPGDFGIQFRPRSQSQE